MNVTTGGDALLANAGCRRRDAMNRPATRPDDGPTTRVFSARLTKMGSSAGPARTPELHASLGILVQPLRSARAYHPAAASVPPSTGIVCPVTNRASSEARNSTTAA